MPGSPLIWQINEHAIYRLRYEAGMSQRELAEAADIKPNALCQYETGVRRYPADPDVVRRLAKAFSKRLGRTIEPEELLRPREPRSEPEPVGASA
jgi:transcriptional regulator with XRE-family HTH domain